MGDLGVNLPELVCLRFILQVAMKIRTRGNRPNAPFQRSLDWNLTRKPTNLINLTIGDTGIPTIASWGSGSRVDPC